MSIKDPLVEKIAALLADPRIKKYSFFAIKTEDVERLHAYLTSNPHTQGERPALYNCGPSGPLKKEWMRYIGFNFNQPSSASLPLLYTIADYVEHSASKG